MAEKKYAFIKNNEVVNITLFDDPTFELLEHFKSLNNLDEIVACPDDLIVGSTYDGTDFIGIQPYLSWVLNLETKEWEAPYPKPISNNPKKDYYWNEETQSWSI